ncbi:YgaP family membrane protein [Arundinibacter roseus]|uniref:DUF2892 domain-containing protein n=1 Tax=Arundinibacter roseus TaxID=2070510 RepID=A0A4R4K1F2_9BACT|nr:DUF2892 domain-containing protein [Arundinibacter roseus]TDB61114.1 DUF2892 domain-containing protein [Arundinibacter roseus]
MTKNMGTNDRLLRVLVAMIAIILYYAGILTGALGSIALILSGIFILTSFVSFCPLYTLFGFSTCPIKK